jgi:DNA-binding FadR family transcriptional regulator
VRAQFTGNPIFAALHDAMSRWLKEQRIVTLEAEAKGQERIADEAHDAVFRAIASGDPDAVEAAMAAHLEQLAATFWCRQPEME